MPTLHAPDNALLHRASACMRNSPEPEVTVFFEALPLTDPAESLQHMLAPIWGCAPADVEVQLLCSAAYVLRHWTVGGPESGDARLFEIGFDADGRVNYLVPERTMLLVPPMQLQRLIKAQRMAETLANCGYTVDTTERAANREAQRIERAVAAAGSVA